MDPLQETILQPPSSNKLEASVYEASPNAECI
jgi:hypothetical protein